MPLRTLSLTLVWVLVLLCYLIPYGPLRHVNAWYGSFLFWTVTGVLVIVLNLLATREFNDGDEA